jgi:hypothetical protein
VVAIALGVLLGDGILVLVGTAIGAVGVALVLALGQAVLTALENLL